MFDQTPYQDPVKLHIQVQLPTELDSTSELSALLHTLEAATVYNVARMIVTIDESVSQRTMKLKVVETFSTFPEQISWLATNGEVLISGGSRSENFRQFKSKVDSVYGVGCQIACLPMPGAGKAGS